MRRAYFRIFIITSLISVVSLTHVSRTPPIFDKCIDKNLHALLKIIILSEEDPTKPTTVVEKNLKVENIMRMIKEYLEEERKLPESDSRRSRRFFFWPYNSWSLEGGLHGGIRGGWSTQGFNIDVDLDGGAESYYWWWRR